MIHHGMVISDSSSELTLGSTKFSDGIYVEERTLWKLYVVMVMIAFVVGVSSC